MTWFKVDDGLAFHPKAVAAGNAAMGLWVRAGSWSAQQLTDGHVPSHMVRVLGNLSQAKQLVAAGLWEQVDGGYRFWQWIERNPDREQVEAEQATKHAAKVEAGRRGGVASGMVRVKQTRSRHEAPASSVLEADAKQLLPEVEAERSSLLKQNEAPSRPVPLRTNTPPPSVGTPSPQAATTTTPRGHRIPDTFVITEAMAAWAAEIGMRPEWVARHTESFIDYWRGKPGAAGRKLDWAGTWRNWLRREHENATTSRSSSQNGIPAHQANAFWNA